MLHKHETLSLEANYYNIFIMLCIFNISFKKYWSNFGNILQLLLIIVRQHQNITLLGKLKFQFTLRFSALLATFAIRRQSALKTYHIKRVIFRKFKP